MIDNERNNYIIELYNVIANELIDLKDSKFKYLIDEETLSFTCDEFILSFDQIYYIFVISFRVGEQSYKSAQTMSVLLKYIESHELHILEDSYFDKKNKRLLYGTEAVIERQLETLRKFGKEKCIMCDSIAAKESINEHGICEFCEAQYDEILWC